MRFAISCGRKFHSDHLAAALLNRGALQQVITANPPFAYRRHPSLAGHVRHTFPFYIPSLLASRFAGTRGLSPHLAWWATRRFDAEVARTLPQSDVLLAWAWSARRSFEIARQRGITCVLEECGSANLHQETLLADEYSRLGLPYRNPIATRVIENERRECELADYILCPSQYVADSFSVYGVSPERCIVIPYATNPRFKASAPKRVAMPLQILYVGSVGVRKGILYLLAALALLDDPRIQCTVIGRIDPDLAPLLAPYQHRFRHVSSVPHEEMPRYFSEAHLFVLPTLDEGMAYVVMEALASGTPVLTTPHSGALGVVRDRHNGFVVPIRDAEAIASSLAQCLDHPALIADLSRHALNTATAWSWDDYAEALQIALTSS